MSFCFNDLFFNIAREEFNLLEKSFSSETYDNMLSKLKTRCEEHLSELLPNYQVKLFNKSELTYDLVMLGSETKICNLTFEKFYNTVDFMVMIASSDSALIMITSIPKKDNDDLKITILDTSNPDTIAKVITEILSLR